MTILRSGTLRGQDAPSNKLNVALAGVWGRGTAHYNSLIRENVVALCDINDQRLKEALQIFPRAKTYWKRTDKFVFQIQCERIAAFVGDEHQASDHDDGSQSSSGAS